MDILGIRTSPTVVRYAILSWDGHTGHLANASGENRLVFPAGIQTVDGKLYWLYQELERVLRQFPHLGKIVIKTNEYVGSETSNTRLSAYFDGAVLLFAGQKGLPIKTKLYSNIGSRRKDVKQTAETTVGSTDSHWDIQMADAIVAAWSEKE